MRAGSARSRSGWIHLANDGEQGELDLVQGFENVTGGGANDLLIGNDLRNVLHGSAGDDALRAGAATTSWLVRTAPMSATGAPAPTRVKPRPPSAVPEPTSVAARQTVTSHAGDCAAWRLGGASSR